MFQYCDLVRRDTHCTVHFRVKKNFFHHGDLLGIKRCRILVSVWLLFSACFFAPVPISTHPTVCHLALDEHCGATTIKVPRWRMRWRKVLWETAYPLRPIIYVDIHIVYNWVCIPKSVHISIKLITALSLLIQSIVSCTVLEAWWKVV